MLPDGSMLFNGIRNTFYRPDRTQWSDSQHLQDRRIHYLLNAIEYSLVCAGGTLMGVYGISQTVRMVKIINDWEQKVFSGTALTLAGIALASRAVSLGTSALISIKSWQIMGEPSDLKAAEAGLKEIEPLKTFAKRATNLQLIALGCGLINIFLWMWKWDRDQDLIVLSTACLAQQSSLKTAVEASLSSAYR